MADKEFYEQTTLPHFVKEKESIPSKIGPYKIESLLSKGGMSLLYLGISPENTPLVVKVLSPNYVSHPEMVDQFLEEAKIIGLTDHPNIVKLYGQGEWEKGLYIAMEFIQGISLRQFIIQHSLSLKRSLDIILQVAYALLHLHTHGVVHRDLKPENILITEDGKVKVIDFGIAQLTMDRQQMTTGRGGIIGTPSYMSPEQKRDPLHVTYASDIYSLGVILYELVIGKLSFGNIQLSLLPKKLRPIVEKALQPKVKERYSDIVDFITDISNYLKQETYIQERTGEDEVKEIREHLQNAHNYLLPKIPRHWADFDLSIAKTSNYPYFGIYYDFFQLKDRSYLIFLAQTEKNQIKELLHLALLKGILQKEKDNFTENIRIDDLAGELNTIFTAKSTRAKIALNILHLDPLNDIFSFVSCGMGSILHYIMDRLSFRQLINQNPPLGETRGYNFSAVTDNWAEGDILLAHTFHGYRKELDQIEELDKEIENAFSQYVHLSSANLSDHILKKIHQTHFSLNEKSHAVICLQRMA